MRIVAFLLSMGLANAAGAETIHFATEDYPPYNFREEGQYRGVGYEQAIGLMQYVKADHTIEMMPWARALSLAETDKMYCVFTTAHIAERDKRFKWVEPLAIDRNVMIANKASGIEPRSIEEARQYIVGTQRNDYTQDLLERNGFPKIDLATDLKLTFKKLMSGRIDLMPISEKYFEDLKAEGNAIEALFVLSEQKFSIACNLDFPDALLSQMQAGLDKLIADGTQRAIFQKYKMPISN
ncbi:substrate-binding periplasmic protein [Ciceribacter naphthalenivorans]|uniref:ABC transporter substrate-binding protein n=3 Tax=Pseudomonadota TaxID=1224 RepID=A0A512HEQ1_9HYPH|nr:transporter substrate-binding domain-containing protein [Ciceribacter naphthalenivorans]GEO83929.1 ABC transporter substrate-binding protein [Ciceribacter naphthalenivorans]GLR21193.1 ABC transporter substrate-binding protein [Ciceribacter naphthalenivorans]GLT04049.1 ABC transporter substrate-binding protein [Sphingomonas psychrolutea]